MRFIVTALSPILAISVATLTATTAWGGGCTQWLPGPMVPPIAGTNGKVYAAIEWTPIGQSPLLIIGGEFTQVGGAEVNNIAAWDGQFWRALNTGLNGTVRALAVYNNQLIAGGDFLSPGRRIATWNGSTWAGMGDFGPPETGGQDGVRALKVFNGSLYAGGYFCCVNQTPISANCARYVGGISWSDAAGLVGLVHALEVFDQDGGGPLAPALYIGGETYLPAHSSLRRTTDGVSASNVSGPSGPVFCLAAVNQVGSGEPGGLVVGGQFANWMNGGSPTVVNNIARYDGTSGHDIGGGLGDGSDHIFAVREFGGTVHAAGRFEDNNFQNWGIFNIARFVSPTHGWDFFGGSGAGGGVIGNSVNVLADYSVPFSGLFVGGEFTGIFGVQAANNIAVWRPQLWGGFNENLRVRAASVIGTRLVMGGQFSQSVPASGAVRNPLNIMTWDGANKGSLGLGTNNTVRALLSYVSGSGPLASNVIIAGGDFTTVYGDQFSPSTPIAASRIAQWTEPQGGTLPTWSNMGQGLDGSVHALERFMGNVVAGGAFSWSGLTNINRLAKWAGSPPTWQPLTTPAPDFNGPVWAMKSFLADFGGTDSFLVVAGAFTSAPGTGVAANRIVLRRESPIAGQSAWQALGAGLNNTVYAVERYGSGLNVFIYAAGDFTASGATPVNRIARLNGANWVAVGNGIGFNGTVYALKSSGGFLYAAGAFTSVDGIAANGVARWNGTAWSAVDLGLSGPVSGALVGEALALFRGEVVTGGVFTSVGSPAIASPAVGRFTPNNVPWIAQQPTAKSVPCGATADFTVTPAPGYATTFQWRRAGVSLSNGTTPAGSVIAGASTAALSIANLQPGDDGAIDCVISTACGSVTSTTVALTITGTCAPLCPADIAPAPNGDGLVNVQDLLAIIGAWGACANPNDCRADIAPVGPPMGDDLVNVQDLLAVIGAWGACP